MPDEMVPEGSVRQVLYVLWVLFIGPVRPIGPMGPVGFSRPKARPFLQSALLPGILEFREAIERCTSVPSPRWIDDK